MKKTFCTFAAALLLSISPYVQANDLLTLEAFKFYAVECYKDGGYSYSSNNRGHSWTPIDAEEVFLKVKYMKDMALMNGAMGGQRITDKELTSYLANNAPAQAKALEKSNVLRCQGGTVRTPSAKKATPKSPPAVTSSKATTSAATPTSKDIPFIGARAFNFMGGSGTGYSIQIAANGDTRIESHGRTDSTVVYQGPFTNPIRSNGGEAFLFKNGKIYSLDGEKIQQDCRGDELDCVSELHVIAEDTATPGPSPSAKKPSTSRDRFEALDTTKFSFDSYCSWWAVNDDERIVMVSVGDGINEVVLSRNGKAVHVFLQQSSETHFRWGSKNDDVRVDFGNLGESKSILTLNDRPNNIMIMEKIDFGCRD